jgi:hypothetical protein
MHITFPSGIPIPLTEIFAFEFTSGEGPSDAAVAITLMSGVQIHVQGLDAEYVVHQINVAKALGGKWAMDTRFQEGLKAMSAVNGK